ncbi:MAG: aromatic amino acid transport family protein [Candidatus Aenigmatarchaeota archaeon]
MGKTLAASFTFAGTIIGAGVLGIPAALSSNGFLVGSLILLAVGAVSLLISLMLGEVVLRTKDPHQLPGLAEKYAGKNVKKIAMVFSVLSIYGAVIAYLHGSGLVISGLFGVETSLARLIFFLPLAVVTYFGIRGVEESETVLTGLLILCIVLLSAGALFFFDPANIRAASLSNILLPVGILIFAFEGLPAIPEMKEILWKEKKSLKKSIMLGFSIPLIAYLMFTLACIGALGQNIGEVATLSLSQYGGFFLLFGNIFALFAMATGFIALSNALAEIYCQDLRVCRRRAWLLSTVAPLFMLLAIDIISAANFTKILSYTGTLFIGPYMLMVVYVFWRAKTRGERTPEYEIKVPRFVSRAIMGALLLVSVWGILSFL